MNKPKQIKKLKLMGCTSTDMEIINKINEVIDAVNQLKKKE